ncbi:MAG: SPASM domain-containing protein [Acidobacteriota bacterium]
MRRGPGEQQVCHAQSQSGPDGVLIPCPGFADTRFRDGMPSLFEVEISRIWLESPLLSIANMKKKELLANNHECAGCKWFEECGLGCRASAVMATGDPFARDPVACAMWRGGFKQKFLAMLR